MVLPSPIPVLNISQNQVFLLSVGATLEFKPNHSSHRAEHSRSANGSLNCTGFIFCTFLSNTSYFEINYNQSQSRELFIEWFGRDPQGCPIPAPSTIPGCSEPCPTWPLVPPFPEGFSLRTSRSSASHSPEFWWLVMRALERIWRGFFPFVILLAKRRARVHQGKSHKSSTSG